MPRKKALSRHADLATLQNERHLFAATQAKDCKDPGDLAIYLHDIEACNGFREADRIYFEQSANDNNIRVIEIGD